MGRPLIVLHARGKCTRIKVSLIYIMCVIWISRRTWSHKTYKKDKTTEYIDLRLLITSLVSSNLYLLQYNVVYTVDMIRVITKLPNSEQSSKGKVKTYKFINRQNQSTTGKLWKPQWPWLGTGISKEMVGWIRF